MTESAQQQAEMMPGLSEAAPEAAPLSAAPPTLLEEWGKAVQANDLKKMDALLAQGFDVNQKFEKNLTTLFFAAYLGNQAMVKFLLERGAVVDQNVKVAAEASQAAPDVKTAVKRMVNEAFKKQNPLHASAAQHHPSGTVGTALHKVLHESWGSDDWLHSLAFSYFIKLADANHAKKTKTGFELLMNGKKVSWNAPTQESPEMVTGVAKDFDQNTADAMVALARLRGWRTMNVHGTTEQKDLLWLAIQRQNRLEKEAFENGQKNGSIPLKDKDGKPVEYKPLTAGNYKPAADSPAMQAYMQEQAEYDAQHAPPAAVSAAPAEVPKPTEPAKTETSTAPAAPAAPVAASAPEAKTEKKDAPKPKKKAADSKVGSQFKKSVDKKHKPAAGKAKPKKKHGCKCAATPGK